MKAVITGAAGFIGSHLVEELLSRGHEVIGVDNLSTGRMSNLASVQAAEAFSFHDESVLEPSDLPELIEQSDVVYHLAAAVGVKYVLEHPVVALETNARGTENVLRLALAHGHKKLILASSSEVYGKASKLPFSEDDDAVLGPTSVGRWGYACGKAFDEFMALAYHTEYGLPVCIVRLFNTVGPRQQGRYGMVLPRFVSQALADEPVTVYGDGEQMRSFTYVKDVVQALADIALVPEAEGQVFNVGSDRETSINQLAELVCQVVDSKSETVHIPFSEVYGDHFEEARRRLPNLSKLQKYIHYHPTSDLRLMIRAVADGLTVEEAHGTKGT